MDSHFMTSPDLFPIDNYQLSDLNNKLVLSNIELNFAG